MKYLLSLLIASAFTCHLFAESTSEASLDRQTQAELIDVATGGEPALTDALFPKTMEIGTIVASGDMKKRIFANAFLARALWPDVRLIEKCQIPESDLVRKAVKETIAEVQEVLRPYASFEEQLKHRIVCAKIPTPSGQIGSVVTSDRILWKLKSDKATIEVQNDGAVTSFLIVPRNARLSAETWSEFSVRVVREITTLPRDVNVEVKFHTQGDRPIMSGSMQETLVSKIRADDRKWYESTSLATHPKFVYLVVTQKNERRNHPHAKLLFGFPDRF